MLVSVTDHKLHSDMFTQKLLGRKISVCSIARISTATRHRRRLRRRVFHHSRQRCQYSDQELISCSF